LILLTKDIPMNGRFLLNRADAKIMGVGAGIADWLNVDPLLVRLGLVAGLLITGPVVILFYLLTGWLASDR
jgi:phage shock protein C